MTLRALAAPSERAVPDDRRNGTVSQLKPRENIRYGGAVLREDHRVRRVSPGGIITTVAGNGTAGFAGDGLAATLAELDRPHGLAVGADGTLYIADEDNERVRAVTPGGIISTIAGTGVAADSGEGGPATAGALRSPCGLAFGADGTLYVADRDNHKIKKLPPLMPGLSTSVRPCRRP